MMYRQKPQKSKTIKKAPKRKINMKNYIRGFIFCCLWYLSIIAGFFLFICPLIPLVVISPKRYRKWSDIVFGMWEPFPVAIMEVCFGIRAVVSGDKINPYEGSLFVMNHRTRVDWNFLWIGLFHSCQPNAHNMKYILKSSLMHFPGLGWVMQTCSFIFLHRDWTRDKPLLNNILDYLNESDLYQILIFPEGTDLTENNIQISNQYAEENNLEKYTRVLHPRTTGFAFIVGKMKSGGHLKAIYDITIAYPKTMPQTEMDLLCGKFPEEVHFDVKRYGSSSIPYDEEELKNWLNAIWKEKEKKLERFYTTGRFTEGEAAESGSILSVSSVSNQDVDFGKMNIKNGVIKYDVGEDPTTKGISIIREGSLKDEPDTREDGEESTTAAKETPAESVPEAKAPESEKGGENSGAAAVTGSSTQSLASAYAKGQLPTESDKTFLQNRFYRPSHLLYIVFVFWITLIIFTIHQLFYNSYLQIWVLTHSILFTILSIVSNGFHHVAAAFYFYKYEKKPELKKKIE